MTLDRRLFGMALVFALSASAWGIDPIISSSDTILAIALDGNSSYPAGEGPNYLVDSNANTKYLNFGGATSGFIVTLNGPAAIANSFQLTTANDAPDRDPTSYEIYGTNDPIQSTDNSTAMGGEVWTLLGSGNVSLPATRLTDGPIVSFTNATSYQSYRMVFPTLNGGPLFQVADAQLFDPGMAELLDMSEANSVLATNQNGNSSYPMGEGPRFAIDNNVNTKYLNFGGVNSGFIVEPEGAHAGEPVRAFAFTTANDEPNRDPIGWELYGTDDPVTSPDNSTGSSESWTLIDSGSMNDLEMPMARTAQGTSVAVDNNVAYDSYRMVFPTRRGSANSIQFSGVQFFNAVPEPVAMASVLAGMALLVFNRRRRLV